jgi:hypothetical protein
MARLSASLAAIMRIRTLVAPARIDPIGRIEGRFGSAKTRKKEAVGGEGEKQASA